MAASLTKAEAAVDYVLWRLTQDGMLAYLIGPGSESWSRLTEAQAERLGIETEQYRDDVWSRCRPVRARPDPNA